MAVSNQAGDGVGRWTEYSDWTGCARLRAIQNAKKLDLKIRFNESSKYFNGIKFIYLDSYGYIYFLIFKNNLNFAIQARLKEWSPRIA
jgi:hypothetical protein